MHLIYLLPFTNAAKVFTAPSPKLDMSAFPALDTLVPIDRSFMSLYDFSSVPNIAINSPPAALGPPNCTLVANPTAAGTCLWSCGSCLRTGDINSCPKQYSFGLSFDDGPAPSTNGILDYLATKDIRGTFFVVGSRVKEYPQIVQRMFEEGHQIAIHTWSHRALTTLSNEQIVSELEYTMRAIEQITGTRPTFVRPPFGDHDDRVRAIFKAMGLRIALWDFETDDWRMVNTPNYFPGTSFQDRIYDRAKAQESQSTGLISLHHDLYKAAMDKTPAALDRVLTTKMVPMTLSQCAGDAPYKNSALVIPDTFANGRPSVANPSTSPGSTNSSGSLGRMLWNELWSFSPLLSFLALYL